MTGAKVYGASVWDVETDEETKQTGLIITPEPIRFTDQDHLLTLMAQEIIAPAEKLIERRQQRLDKIFGRA